MSRSSTPDAWRFTLGLPATARNWSDETDPRWLVTGVVRMNERDQPIVTELAISTLEEESPDLAGQGLTTEHIRSIPFGGITTAVRDEIQALDPEIYRSVRERFFPELSVEEHRASTARLGEIIERAANMKRGPGRPPLSSAELRRVAEERLRVQQDGFTRGVNIELAKRLGDIPASTAADHVNKARRAGFLAPGTRGRSDVAAGPRLLKAWETERAELNKEREE